MFSYRHAFHAGNHADVIKHSILIQVIEYFKQKTNPFWLIDTHAGNGLYDLSDAWASHSAEANTGLKKISDQEKAPELIANYINLIKGFNRQAEMHIYPGSPAIAYKCLRPADRLFMFELLEAEYIKLNELFFKQYRASQKHVTILLQNGFDGAAKLLPPQPRRGIIFIDPSYENKADYKQVLNSLKIYLRKYPQGTYIIWHPLIQRVQANEMLISLKNMQLKWLHASLTVHKPSDDGRGMHGSGMFIINPPWTLYDSLNECLPWLSNALAQDKHAFYTLDKFEP